MAFQTFENDKNNRGQTKRKNLKNEIRSTWLGMKNDYRILIGVDELDVVVKDDYEIEESENV